MTEQQEFEAWWDQDCDTKENPYSQHSMMYWAWEAWKAGRAKLAQPEPYPENFIDALRFDTALREPEPEPVVIDPDGTIRLLKHSPQHKWVGLTDVEIDDIWSEFNDGYGIIEETLWGYERAIETKLKEKNGF